MFQELILPIFRSTRLCVTVCGINAPTMLPTRHRPATSWVHYTTSCNTQSSAPENGQNNCPKHVLLTGIIKKLSLLHLVGCLYYLYFIIFFWGLLNSLNLNLILKTCRIWRAPNNASKWQTGFYLAFKDYTVIIIIIIIIISNNNVHHTQTHTNTHTHHTQNLIPSTPPGTMFW